MGLNAQGKLQFVAKGIEKLGLKNAFKTKRSDNQMASIFDDADKKDGKQTGTVSDKDLAKAIENSSAYGELSKDEESFAMDIMNSFEEDSYNVTSNPFTSKVDTLSSIVAKTISAININTSNSNQGTGWENIQSVKLTGSETLEELKQGKEDTEEKLEKAEKSVNENEAVEKAKKSVNSAKAEYEKAISDFEAQKDAEIQAKNSEKIITEEKIKTQKANISNTEQSITEKSQAIAIQKDKLAKLEKAKPSIKDYQKEEIDEDGNVRVYTDFQAYMQAMRKWKKEKEKLENKIENLEENKKELEEKLKEEKQVLKDLQDKNAKIKKEIQQLKEEKAQKNSKEIISAKENYDKKQRELTEITQRATDLQTKARGILSSDLDTYVSAINGKEKDEEEQEFIA